MALVFGQVCVCWLYVGTQGDDGDDGEITGGGRSRAARNWTIDAFLFYLQHLLGFKLTNLSYIERNISNTAREVILML